MALQRQSFVAFVFPIVVGSSFGLQYWVGDSVWSIPPYPNFYNDWSSSHVFHTADSLVFDFESELYNLMQVTRLDYQNCRATNPIKLLNTSPATIVLNEPGVFYYLCNLSNYCDLGQKITVVVHRKNSSPAPAPVISPVLAPAPALSPVLAPAKSPSSLPLTPVLSPEQSPYNLNVSESPMPAGVSTETPSTPTNMGHSKSSGSCFSRLSASFLLLHFIFCV